jgi:hypothetical protein
MALDDSSAAVDRRDKGLTLKGGANMLGVSDLAKAAIRGSEFSTA